MKALVFDGRIVEIKAKEFPVHEALTWHDITGLSPKPKVGWTYDGIAFSSPPPVPPRPDSDAMIDAAIDGAATFAALKAVLKGKVKAR